MKNTATTLVIALLLIFTPSHSQAYDPPISYILYDELVFTFDGYAEAENGQVDPAFQRFRDLFLKESDQVKSSSFADKFLSSFLAQSTKSITKEIVKDISKEDLDVKIFHPDLRKDWVFTNKTMIFSVRYTAQSVGIDGEQKGIGIISITPMKPHVEKAGFPFYASQVSVLEELSASKAFQLPDDENTAKESLKNALRDIIRTQLHKLVVVDENGERL